MGLNARALPMLRLAGVVLGTAALAAGGTAYWLFISAQHQYLIGRDFRVLSNLATQIDTTVALEAQVVVNAVGVSGAVPARSDKSKSRQARWIALRGKPFQAEDINFEDVKTDTGLPPKRPDYQYRFNKDGFLTVPIWPSDDANRPQIAWRPDDPNHPQIATLRLRRVLEPIFREKVEQGAFDAILLGDRNGRVLIGAGEAANQIRSSGLGVLAAKGADGKPVPFAEMAQSIRTSNVSFADVDYTLFAFPCCTLESSEPLVLVGLIRADVLRSNSWAIPTTLVKSIMVVLLLAVVSWPFLKLILLGDRQQIHSSDFFQLGASSVAGLALVTVILLDITAYWCLNADIDVQLQQFAAELDSRAVAEVRHAYNQLDCLERNLDLPSGKGIRSDQPGSVLEKTLEGCANGDKAGDLPPGADRLNPAPSLAWEYPFFETAAFIDEDGQQQLKFVTSNIVPDLIKVADRNYFKIIAGGAGWSKPDFCNDGNKCAFESVWSWTTGTPRAVLAKTARLPAHWKAGKKPIPVSAISIPMRSLINPVLPPGFAFAVIDRTGKVLFHSDGQRMLNENFFVEADNNRRLRAQVSANSAEPLNVSYWGSDYRAYLKPMSLPNLYVVTLSHKERAWAINREWLVVALIFIAVYLGLWLTAALLTLGKTASWVWPDPARVPEYISVSLLCAALILTAALAARRSDYMALLVLGIALPLAGWILTYVLLHHRPVKGRSDRREPVLAYSIAAVLLLVVTGVVPGALLFLASYQLHARSYIKNSQLIVARRLADRFDRLTEEYLGPTAKAKSRTPVATHVGVVEDTDVYVDFLYETSVVREVPASPIVSAKAPVDTPPIDDEGGDLVLSFLEDYLPYYSESSVEWRELLHEHASDTAWSSRASDPPSDGRIVFSMRQPNLPVELTSRVPSMRSAPLRRVGLHPPVGTARLPGQPVGTTGAGVEGPVPPVGRSPVPLLVMATAVLALTWAVAQVFMRRVFLVGITQPLWACDDLAINAGENVLEIRERTSTPPDREGIRPLKLGPIVHDKDMPRAWRRALLSLDKDTSSGTVLIDDFDDELDDARVMDQKLSLLEELAADQSRTVVVVSGVPTRTLTDSMRHSARVLTATRQKRARDRGAAAPDPIDSPLERWRRLLRSFVIVERWEEPEPSQPEPKVNEPETAGVALASLPALTRGAASWSRRFAGLGRHPVLALLDAEGGKLVHPYVRRVCEDLRTSKAVQNGRLNRQQAFDEIVERTKQFYRAQWESCSEDEKVVLGHIAQHGLANVSVRGTVRRLLGRRLLCKDPALRPMNETFRRFILTRECTEQVTALETAYGPSTWDRLRIPLAVAVVGAGVFLFATQKELYNAIVGVTTAAAVSVPTLIRAVGMLAGRPATEAGVRA
jgi:hypothetical protein